MHRFRGERGSALVEAAITVPIILLIAVGIFEFGRAYQTWQILTNAAREGARVAVLPGSTNAGVTSRVRSSMESGQLSKYGTAPVTVNRNDSITVDGEAVSASKVTVDYPFDFMVLLPVARLITPTTTLGSSITMRAEALMRNEFQ